MYRKIIAALDDADTDEKILITVITGDYVIIIFFHYLLSNDDPDTYHLYKLWVDRMIKHSKILIAMVNGPAIGIACTTLALCDAAYLLCPFTQLGITPEAASTSTFVQIMGYQKAARLAMFSEKITPQEACEAGLVSKVITIYFYAIFLYFVLEEYINNKYVVLN
uniref:Calcium-transporting ATPase 13, plasma membrane-type n=1 Tax=Heterorhabditis bacteriophora TaxID=37862 RepID=A0A1I7WKY5_HETBA